MLYCCISTTQGWCVTIGLLSLDFWVNPYNLTQHVATGVMPFGCCMAPYFVVFLHFNQHCCNIQFEEGDQVLILTKDFKSYGKTDAMFIGLYLIIKKISPTVYKLKLPTSIKFHNTFNIDKFKLFVNNPEQFDTRLTPPMPTIIDNHIEYKVKWIIDWHI